MNRVAQSVAVGLRRRWKRGFAAFLSVLGTIWLFTEVLTRVSKDVSLWLDGHGTLYLVMAGGAAIIAFGLASYEARKVYFTVPNTDTTLTLKFGSIFDEDAHWLIGINEFFDSTLGDIVATSSLHGQIIARLYNGNQATFRNDVDNALAAYTGDAVQPAVGQKIKYPLGTTAVIARGPRKVFLVAISKTEIATNRSSSNVPILWDALGEALKQVDSVGNGEPLAMPLIGNGRASLNIPPQHLLRLITLKLVQEARNYDLPRSITINLSDDCFEFLDLIEIKNGWSVV